MEQIIEFEDVATANEWLTKSREVEITARHVVASRRGGRSANERQLEDCVSIFIWYKNKEVPAT